MKTIHELLFAENGVLVRQANKSVRSQLDYALRTGVLKATLPGIYTAPEPTIEARVRAAAFFRPDAVITGAAAASLLWWPEIAVDTVDCAVRQPVSSQYAGFRWTQRAVPDDLIVERSGVRIAAPALSVLDLIPVRGAVVVDEALRRETVTLAQLWEAFLLTPQRPGNAQRRAVLHDSRDVPWSPSERRAHQLLRSAGISGWRTNHPVLVNGVRYVVDLVFPRERIAIEVDGFTFHGTRQAFVADRWRYARLAAAGWTVLPFAASAIDDDPDDFVGLVLDALRTRQFV